MDTPMEGMPLPRIRACLFDMDGLLLDTEDLYTEVLNSILREHNKPDFPWSLKAKMQGSIAPVSATMFMNWAQLPISMDEFKATQIARQAALFPRARPLPGVAALLGRLYAATSPKIHMALATSADRTRFGLKTTHNNQVFSCFAEENRILGDDKRLALGRGKPCPDIFLLALKTLNESLVASGSDEPPIQPDECLVFEDAVSGTEAARRAGMQVVWVPHPGLAEQMQGKEKEVLAGIFSGLSREGDAVQVPLGKIDDGWARQLPSLEDFPYQTYGLKA